MRRDIVNLGLDHGVMQFYVAAATKSKLQWTEETASKVLSEDRVMCAVPQVYQDGLGAWAGA